MVSFVGVQGRSNVQWQWRQRRRLIAMATGQGQWQQGNGHSIKPIVLYVVLQHKTSTIAVGERAQNVRMANIRDVFHSNRTGHFYLQIWCGVSE
jgi:hypothetical protein